MTDPFGGQLDQAGQAARYEAAWDLSHELAGLLIAQEREAATDERREELRARRRELRGQVTGVDPGSSSEVTALLEQLGAELRALREAGGQ